MRFHKHFESVDPKTKEIIVDKEMRHVKSVFVGII